MKMVRSRPLQKTDEKTSRTVKKSKKKSTKHGRDPTSQIRFNHPLKSNSPTSPHFQHTKKSCPPTIAKAKTDWVSQPAPRKRPRFSAPDALMPMSDMAITDEKTPSDGKAWNFFKRPFLHSSNSNTNTSSHSAHHPQNIHSASNNVQVEGSNPLHGSNSVSSVARSLLPARRRLKLDPSNKLYFPCTYCPLLISPVTF